MQTRHCNQLPQNLQLQLQLQLQLHVQKQLHASENRTLSESVRARGRKEEGGRSLFFAHTKVVRVYILCVQ